MERRVAAVVVTRDRLALLKKCIACLLAQDAPCDILLVDNASADGTASWVSGMQKETDRLRCLRLEENTGGAGGFHAGMKWACEEGYTHIWVMDDDTQPQTRALSRLLEAEDAAGEHYGFLSSRVLFTDGTPCKMNEQKLLPRKDQPHQLAAGLRRASQATFVSCLFRAEAVRAAGLPIRAFFIWGDDVEYTRRLAVRMGMPGYRVDGSVAVHAMKDNCGSSIAHDSIKRLDRYRYAYRNEHYLYRKEGISGFAFYTAKCAANLCRILFSARDHRAARCAVILSAYFTGFFFNPEQ